MKEKIWKCGVVQAIGETKNVLLEKTAKVENKNSPVPVLSDLYDRSRIIGTATLKIEDGWLMADIQLENQYEKDYENCKWSISLENKGYTVELQLGKEVSRFNHIVIREVFKIEDMHAIS